MSDVIRLWASRRDRPVANPLRVKWFSTGDSPSLCHGGQGPLTPLAFAAAFASQKAPPVTRRVLFHRAAGRSSNLYLAALPDAVFL